MTKQSTENANKAIELLDKAKEQILIICDSDPVLTFIGMRIRSSLTQLSNSIRAQMGIAPASEEEHRITFEPLTELNGATLKPDTDVEEEDITPVDTEVQQLKAKVLQLEESLPGFSDEQIILSHVTDSDRLAIRGLAKKAGVEDYEIAEINEAFINSIRVGLGQKTFQNTADLLAVLAQVEAATTVAQLDNLLKLSDAPEVKEAVAVKRKPFVLVEIENATTREQVEVLAKGSDDETIQEAALNRIIALEENEQS